MSYITDEQVMELAKAAGYSDYDFYGPRRMVCTENSFSFVKDEGFTMEFERTIKLIKKAWYHDASYES